MENIVTSMLAFVSCRDPERSLSERCARTAREKCCSTSPPVCVAQIIELLAYALVLSGNHVFTSGAMGTNAATIRYAWLSMLTVFCSYLPRSL